MPLSSVLFDWSVGAEALDQLPMIADEQVVDDRHRLGALSDDEMIVATRTYETLTASDIEQALTQAGFNLHYSAGFRWHMMPCRGQRSCGSSSLVLWLRGSELMSVFQWLQRVGGAT